MARVYAALLTVVALFAQPVATALPSRTPTSVGGYILTGPVQRAFVTCATHGAGMMFEGMTLLDPHGNVAIESWMLVDSVSDGFAYVRRGDETTGVDLDSTLPGPAGAGWYEFGLRPGWTFRLGYASWGGPTECRVFADGRVVAPVDASATYGLTTDFETDLAVSTTAGGFVRDGNLEQAADGHLFAFLTTWSHGFPPLGAGTASATGPDGRTRGGTSVLVNEATSGTWRFRLQDTVTIPKLVFASVVLHDA